MPHSGKMMRLAWDFFFVHIATTNCYAVYFGSFRADTLDALVLALSQSRREGEKNIITFDFIAALHPHSRGSNV